MLTGVASPSKGTAYVNNFDIRTSLPNIRRQMGLCPQYNTLFGFMTVMEHLEFFAKLKEREWSPEEATEILERLRIEFKADAASATLSGGQKRKLSLAIALIGGSEVVMLDEPTSGMDPGARHETWTLIQREKERRTILLTTHFMEEADLLGDRIAIMAHGQLECCGSPMFLKQQYGDGYHLTIVYSLNSNPDISLTTETIRSYVPEAQVFSYIGQEATYLLSAKHRPIFPKLFRKLEEQQERCGISSFGVSITTMEEVFLKVGDLAEQRYNAENGIADDNNEMIDRDDPQLQSQSLRVSNRYRCRFRSESSDSIDWSSSPDAAREGNVLQESHLLFPKVDPIPASISVPSGLSLSDGLCFSNHPSRERAGPSSHFVIPILRERQTRTRDL